VVLIVELLTDSLAVGALAVGIPAFGDQSAPPKSYYGSIYSMGPPQLRVALI
jgi:hypothetical protein